MTVKRTLIALGTITALLASSGGAMAGQAASPASSCVAVITSYEATQLDAGFVGNEVSGFATSGPGLGAALVGPLAQNHLGSLAACREVEG